LIAIDTNILVYAHRLDSPYFETAGKLLGNLARDTATWAIPWPCLHEFYSVVTNPKFFVDPTPIAVAIGQIADLIKSPSLVLLTETDRHWIVLRDIVAASSIRGIKIHDAKIAAICLQHGVHEFWSADRDFSRFPELKTVNPLL
jgi:toxin-antitoxin system PIN domain toxin